MPDAAAAGRGGCALDAVVVARFVEAADDD
jgi:hypothetical protein